MSGADVVDDSSVDDMVITVRVGAPAHGGHCIARHEGRAVFVRHALPGELVEARVTSGDSTARFWTADAVNVLEASDDRVESPWSEAGPGGVGGGELGHVALPAQREWKLSVVKEAFERFAKLTFDGQVHAAPGDDERGGLGYRTRVSAVADKQGRAAMTVFGTSDRKRLTAMPLAVPAAEEALLAARATPGTRIEVAVSADGRSHVGWADSGDRSAVIEHVNVAGKDIEFRVRSTDFWQVHRKAPAILAQAVLDGIGDAERVLDLYAGAGLLSVAMASQGRMVTAIELHSGKGRSSLSVNLAPYETSMEIAGDTRRTLEAMAKDGVLFHDGAIVLDPPRSGAKAATVAAMAKLQPGRIVYVACDPVALARDAALLGEHGYTFERADAWDLFPMTHHVETVATFVR